MSLGFDPKQPPYIDLSPHATPYHAKGSHLHKLKKAIPNPNGNRAERRAAKKEKKKYGRKSES